MSEYSANAPNPSPLTSTAGSLLRTSGLIALGNLLSRSLSFAGDLLKSHYFGAGRVVDAFNVAAAVPTLLNDLLITNLVNSAYIPVFSAYEKAERRRLVAALVNLTFLIFTAIALFMEVFAPQIVSLLSGSSPAEVQTLTTDLLHITVPALLMLNLSGILSALLYSQQRLFLPTVAGAVFNGTILLAALGLQSRFGIFSLAFGVLLGATLQVGVQFAGLSGTVWPPQFRLWHPGLRRIAALYLPILAGLLVEIFISRPITFALAAQTGTGGISRMTYALTLRQLPEALIATALSVTVLAKLSAAKNLAEFRSILAQGLHLAVILVLPASVGLFLLARPVTALLFEHGNFTAFDTEMTAQALQWYLLGLPFATVDLLLVVACYARHNTRTPALIGLVSAIAYSLLGEILVPHFGLNSLMLADSFKFLLHAAISTHFLFPSLGSMAGFHISRTVRHVLGASTIMGIAMAGLSVAMSPDTNLIAKLLAVILPVLLGLLIYSGVLTLLHTRLLISILRQQRSKNGW